MDANVAGMRVKVTTSLGETVQGEIFTYDSNTNCVVLGARSVPPHTHTHTHLAPSRRPTDPRASNARTRAEEFIPQTQKKNIRIMKAALLKDVQVLSTPQSRGEQPGVSTHARIPHRSHAAPLRRCGARPEHGLTGCADLAVTAPAKAAGGRAREGGGARAARDGASGRPAAVDRQGS